jgi:hypothetical protein
VAAAAAGDGGGCWLEPRPWEVEIIADLFKPLGRHQVVGLMLSLLLLLLLPPVVKHPSPARNREETSARQGDCHDRSRRVKSGQATLFCASPAIAAIFLNVARPSSFRSITHAVLAPATSPSQGRQGGKGPRINFAPWVSLHQLVLLLAAGCEQQHGVHKKPQCECQARDPSPGCHPSEGKSLCKTL